MVPVVVILGVVVVALLTSGGNSGTLVVEAATSGRYYTARSLTATATVESSTGPTPFNLSLPQGAYSVTYASIQGFAPPSPREVTVIKGQTSYAIAVYQPLVKVVGTQGGLFNVTSVQAIRSVTPVVWLNTKNSYFVINVQPTGRMVLGPDQNFTYVFSQSGSYSYSTLSGNSTGVVQVK